MTDPVKHVDPTWHYPDDYSRQPQPKGITQTAGFIAFLAVAGTLMLWDEWRSRRKRK
jgi:hypothetical protein